MKKSTRQRGKWKNRGGQAPPSEEMDFMYYPEIQDEKFREHIYRKKEFNRSRVSENYAETAKIEDLCGSERSLRPYQEFLRNFISSETPYDGAMLFHGVGVGKCLLPGTNVYINGVLKPIEQIWESYRDPDQIQIDYDGGEWSIPSASLYVNSYDEEHGIMVERPVNHIYRQPIAEKVNVIELEDGQLLRLTENHHLLTENGWSTDFTSNQYVSVPNILHNEKNSQTIRLSTVEMDHLIDLTKCKNHVPDRIMTADPADVKIFLHRILQTECPGSIIQCASRHLIQQIGHLLGLFGIIIQCYYRHTAGVFVARVKPKSIDRFTTIISDFCGDSGAPTRDGVQLVRIKKCYAEMYTGYVYDLEIINHHNYVAGGVLCHNTCSAVTISEGLRPYVEAAGKKIYVLTPSQVESNFKNTLYDFDEEKEEQRQGLDPGSRQCTGLTFYQPPVRGKKKEDARRRAITSKWSKGEREVYKFFNVYGSGFPNYVKDLKETYNIDIGEFFSNSLFVIDEAHNMVTKKGVAAGMGDDDDDDDKSKKRGKGKARFSKAEPEKTISQAQLPTIKEILSKAKNTKLLLLTATPIRDDVTEFIELINLLRINDGQKEMMTYEKLFKGQDPYDPTIPIKQRVDNKYFARMVKGYISYVQGENPISFPEVLYPGDGWTPRPLLDISAGPVLENDSTINQNHFTIPIPEAITTDDGRRIDINLGLVQCHMDDAVQYSAHRSWVETDVRGRDLAIQGLQLSTIVYPVKGGRIQWGEKGFKAVFGEVGKGEDGAGGPGAKKKIVRGKPKQYRWKGSTEELINFMGYHEEGLGYDNEISRNGQINLFSSKFQQLLHRIKGEDSPRSSRGFTFIYCRFVSAGALSVALFLEVNGFVRYHHPEEGRRPFRRNAETGRYDYDSVSAPLLSYDSLPYKRRVFRCYRCCKLDTDPIHQLGRKPNGDKEPGSSEENDPLGLDPHQFAQGSYVLFLDTGKAKRDTAINLTKSKANKWGSLIKFVIGSKVSGEGVNLYNVRQAHILNPWHNLTEIHQARGRAIRNCSHISLPQQFRNVMIFEYCATGPLLMHKPRNSLDADRLLQNTYQDTFRDSWPGNASEIYEQLPHVPADLGHRDNWEIMVETNDERLFRRAFNKDIVTKYLERLSKIHSIDCNFFKPLNVFPSDIPGTRRCDYMECDYTCAWNPDEEKKNDPEWINTDTYNLYFSKVQIDRAVQLVRSLFKKYPALTSKDIVQLIRKKNKNMEIDYIYQALDMILGDPPGRAPLEIMDKMGREGILAYHGNAYVFQPNDVPDPRAPIRYRTKPLQIKDRAQDFKVKVSTEEREAVRKVKEADHRALAEKAVDRLTRMYQQNMNTVRLPYVYEMILDRLPILQLREVFEWFFISTRLRDAVFTPLKGVLIEYLAKRFLLLLKSGDETDPSFGWVDNYGRSSLLRNVGDPRDFNNSKKWRVIGHRIGTPVLAIDDQTKAFAPIGQIQANRPIKIMQDLAENLPLSREVYGFYDPRVTSKDGFKASFTALEKITINEGSGTISQRSIAKGKVIMTYEKSELVAMYNQVQALLHANDTYDVLNRDPDQTQYAGKSELVSDIELGLRALDHLASEEYAASRGKEIGRTRVKYFLYPYQDNVEMQKKPGAGGADGCRRFTAQGHQSNLGTAKKDYDLHTCELKPELLL